jgi:4-hydroxy-tetrahydrodipicolinate reductase
VIPLVLVGAAGRMGRAIREAAAATEDVRVRACVERDPAPGPSAGGPAWGSDLGQIAQAGDVVVEFSTPAAALEAVRVCAERGLPLVSGTTGLTAADEERLREAARRVAVVRAANFSVGLLALRRALDAVLPALAGWDVEIVERHHRGKVDAPSGTALDLARRARELLGYPEDSLRHGRQGRTGVRPEREIGVHALRGGTWVGDHAVVLAGPGEWVELRHVVQDRGAFAQGVIRAARFVVQAPAGFYTLEGVLTAVRP